MQREIQISPTQLSFLIIALLFSDFAIMNPTKAAMRDSWLAFIVGMLLGLLLVTVYLLIAKLNPGKTLIEILLNTFGKVFGTILSLFYIWYFIHLAALVVRSFGEYMITVNYVETPLFFIIIFFMLPVAYGLRKGFDVIAKGMELFVPLIILTTLTLFLMTSYKFEFQFIFPILKDGVKPVLQTGYAVSTFPFGELVILLMIFPYFNEKNKLMKVTYISVIIGGLILFGIVLRDLLVLGPELLSIIVFPPNVSSSLLPTAGLESLISVNLLIGGTGFLYCYIHGITLGISQIFHIEEDRSLIIPVITIVIGLSIWIYDNILEMFRFAKDVSPYYAIPFQIIIPLIVLLISYIRRKREKKD